MELLSSAQFHGAKRIADKGDRWWWAGFLLLVLASALAALVSAIWRYHRNPTFLARVGSKRADPSFPCVIICPELLYPSYKVDALLADLTLPQGINATWLKNNMYTLAALYSPDVAYTLNELETLEYVLEYNNLNVEEVVKNLTPTCDEILLRCRLQQRMEICNHLFKMAFTTYGYCCVFNGRSLQREMNNIEAEERDMTRWLEQDNRDSVGFTNGLMVAINQSQELVDDVDLTYKWVAIQLSQQYVECSYNGTPVSPATEQWIGFGTEQLQIAEDARQLSYALRQCRFSFERLEFFPEYTKAYCNMECMMRRSMQRCNCIPMSFARPPGIPYCRARSLSCGRAAAVPYGSDKCDCPMPCEQERDFTFIQDYEFSEDTAPFDSFYEDLNLQKISIIRIFIPTHNLNMFSRRSVYDSISLFSQMGGVFSVFFGCSILTLLELAQLFYRALYRSNPARCQPKNDATSTVDNRKKNVTFADNRKIRKIKQNKKGLLGK